MSVYICFPEGRIKALTMSYDDGRVQDERLISIFNQYGIKGTFNLNYGPVSRGNPKRIPAERIRELYRGHEVATHGLNHSTLARCPLVEVATEILEDRKGLEALTGTLVRGHCYANGSYTQEVKQALKALGIAYARAWPSVPDFELPTDLYEWHSTCHHNDPKLMEYARDFAQFNKRAYLELMMVSGHSWEFDLQDNWQVIEEFCSFIGGRDDIWYATNIEIVDYLEAARKLKYSGDYQAVYNPSACSVWLEVDKKILEVSPGAYVEFKKDN